MFEKTIYSGINILSPSNYLNSCLNKSYGKQGEVITPGVDTNYFIPATNKKLDPPKILCMSALINADKRINLLVKAFELLKKKIPEAILQLSGHEHERIVHALLSSVDETTRKAIQILGVGSEENVPLLYANATVTVLPGVRQSFGMPLIESLSAGTPVVATNNGGMPEIIDDAKIGILFGGNEVDEPEDLCYALEEAIQLAQAPQTQERCRQYALRYDWDTVIGPKIEKIYLGH
jgi:spore coat protein SA